MSDAKSVAFNRGLALLNASGAHYVIVVGDQTYHTGGLEYAVKLPDGTLKGTLEVVVPKKRRSPNGPRKMWEWTGYLDGVKNLKPGESWTFTCKDKEEAQGLQRTATGRGGQYFGKGNCISAIDYKTFKVELLRVE